MGTNDKLVLDNKDDDVPKSEEDEPEEIKEEPVKAVE